MPRGKKRTMTSTEEERQISKRQRNNFTRYVNDDNDNDDDRLPSNAFVLIFAQKQLFGYYDYLLFVCGQLCDLTCSNCALALIAVNMNLVAK